MAVREQSLMSDVDARDSVGRAQERDWRGASGRSRPTHQEQIRRAVRDARRDQLRRGAESLVRLGVAAIAALLIARLVALPLHATLPPGLVEWIGRLSAPLLAPFAGLLPTIPVLDVTVDTSVLLAVAVYWLIGRGGVSALRLVLGERSETSGWNSNTPFGGTRS